MILRSCFIKDWVVKKFKCVIIQERPRLNLTTLSMSKDSKVNLPDKDTEVQVTSFVACDPVLAVSDLVEDALE